MFYREKATPEKRAKKTKQIDDAMAAAQTTQLEQLANEQGIVLREFDAVLQPIIESCTKDSISAGKYMININRFFQAGF